MFIKRVNTTSETSATIHSVIKEMKPPVMLSHMSDCCNSFFKVDSLSEAMAYMMEVLSDHAEAPVDVNIYFTIVDSVGEHKLMQFTLLAVSSVKVPTIPAPPTIQ